MNTKEAFFKDMAESLDYWTETTLSAITSDDDGTRSSEDSESFKNLQSILMKNGADKKDIEKMLFGCLRGVSHSFLNILDGATSISDDGRKVFLVDEKGQLLGEGLHHDFIGYLFDTGRLK